MKLFFENLFLKCTGYTYSNMARLFIRLFVGIMFLQFGIRHLINYSSLAPIFPSVMGFSGATSLTLMICVEMICSILIMVGFLTRLAVIPAIISMICAEHHILHFISPGTMPYLISSIQPGYLPIMFIGIFIYILIAGPGKISLDYFISLFIVSRRGKDDSEEMDEI